MPIGQVGAESVSGGSSGSGVSGSGTANKVAKWTAATTLGNSNISDSGTEVSVAVLTKIGADGAPNSLNTLYAGDNSLEPFGWGTGASQIGRLSYAGGAAVVQGISGQGLSLGSNGGTGDLALSTTHALSFGSAVSAITFGNAAFQSCTGFTTNGAGVLACTASDERLKDIVGPSAEGLQAVLGITPQRFLWKDGRREGTQSGLIAQDVEKVIPLGVSVNGEGFLQLEKDAITGALINAIKELHGMVEDLQNQVLTLSAKKS